MTQLQQPFNPMAVDPTQSGGAALPVGKYPVKIVASEIKATKANDGGMLVLELEILDGPNAGQSGKHNMNLYNKNDDTRTIAEKQLSAICHAVGYFHVLENVQAIHNIPFAVDVKLQKGEEAAAKGFTNVSRILMADGSDIISSGQARQSPPAQQQQPAAQQQWAAAPPAQAPAQQAWGGQQATAPAQAPAAPPAWQQGAAGGAPAWGKK